MRQPNVGRRGRTDHPIDLLQRRAVRFAGAGLASGAGQCLVGTRMRISEIAPRMHVGHLPAAGGAGLLVAMLFTSDVLAIYASGGIAMAVASLVFVGSRQRSAKEYGAVLCLWIAVCAIAMLGASGRS